MLPRASQLKYRASNETVWQADSATIDGRPSAELRWELCAIWCLFD